MFLIQMKLKLSIFHWFECDNSSFHFTIIFHFIVFFQFFLGIFTSVLGRRGLLCVMFGQEQCLSFTLSLVPETKDMCLVGHKFKLQQLVQEFHCGASLTLTGASLQLTLIQVYTFLQNVLNPGTVQKLTLRQQIECIFVLSTIFLQSALLIISIAAATKPCYSPGKESSRVPMVPEVQNWNSGSA